MAGQFWTLLIVIAAWSCLCSTLTSTPCLIPANSAAGFCIAADKCQAYQTLKQTAVVVGEAAQQEFIASLNCSRSADAYFVCCPLNSVYAIPQTSAHDESNIKAQCGLEVSGMRIIGGQKTEIDEFPWLALLFYESDDSDALVPKCGGALISDLWILTAAHCVTGRDSKKLKMIRLGEHDLDTEKDCQRNDCADPVVDREIRISIPHPNYVRSSWSKDNDLALIKLKKAVSFSDFVRPICLPYFFSIPETHLNAAEQLVASGWGHTDFYQTDVFVPSKVKLKVALPQVQLSECQKIYSEYQVPIKETQICAGGRNHQDTCRGDSGSPLMIYDTVKGRWFAYGVVSRGPSHCGSEGLPSIYTNLFRFGDWIRRTMANN